ncbi:hypothetical protein [Cupriavidus oxalaticus]|uniref:hypothetical protein n=1 Tax=Cupriavidus oxalaticus TaxID=96344 RepID=UPI00316EB861
MSAGYGHNEAKGWRPAQLGAVNGMAPVVSDAQFAPTPGSAVSVRFFSPAPA